MRLRVLKPWHGRKVGTVMTEIPDGVAELLICRGVMERCGEEPEPDPLPQPSANGQGKRQRQRRR